MKPFLGLKLCFLIMIWMNRQKESQEGLLIMHGLTVISSIAFTAVSVLLVKLLERKIGAGTGGKIGLSFAVPVFILFLTANMYMINKNAEGSYLILNVLLLTAVVSSYQDMKYREIEDEIHIAALGAGLMGLVIKGFQPLDAFLGLLAGGGILLLIAILTKGGMGGADIKLNAVYGTILGLRLLVLSLVIAFAAGALASLLLILFRIKNRKDVIPFSPFLSIGALTAFVFGKSIAGIYLGFF